MRTTGGSIERAPSSSQKEERKKERPTHSNLDGWMDGWMDPSIILLPSLGTSQKHLRWWLSCGKLMALMGMESDSSTITQWCVVVAGVRLPSHCCCPCNSVGGKQGQHTSIHADFLQFDSVALARSLSFVRSFVRWHPSIACNAHRAANRWVGGWALNHVWTVYTREQEGCGIATGMFMSALQNVGLATLTR